MIFYRFHRYCSHWQWQSTSQASISSHMMADCIGNRSACSLMRKALELASPADEGGLVLHKIVQDFQCSQEWVKVLWCARTPRRKIYSLKCANDFLQLSSKRQKIFWFDQNYKNRKNLYLEHRHNYLEQRALVKKQLPESTKTKSFDESKQTNETVLEIYVRKKIIQIIDNKSLSRLTGYQYHDHQTTCWLQRKK